MTSFNLTFIILSLFMIITCHGFNFSMDRKEYLIKNQTYCGLLQCQVDTVSDTNMASLIKMDIYYFINEQLLVSMLAENSDIEDHTGNNTIVVGSMSKNHGEFHVYFSDVSNCTDNYFMCKIQFKNSTHGIEFDKKIILPINSDQNTAEIYVKSQISIEQKFFNKAGALINKLKPNNRILNEGTGFSLTFGHPSLINSEEISKQPNKTETGPWQNATNNFEQKLSDFEVKIGKQLDIFMNQMSTKMEDMKNISKENDLKLNELKEKEIIRRSEQSTSAIIQSHIDLKLSTLERRMDDIIDQVNVSLNLLELKTNANCLWIIQKLDVLLDANRLIGLNVSTLEIKVTEIINSEGHMNEAIKEILKYDRQMNATITEILKNERQIKDNMNEILNNDIHINDTIKELLKYNRQMNDTMKEILNNDRHMKDTMKEILMSERQMNDTMKEILKNDRQMNDAIKELLKNDKKMNDTMEEIQLEVKPINKILKEGEMMGEIQKSITLKITDLQKSVHAKCNFDTLRAITDQRLSSVEENLKELRIGHETIETSLVNVTRSLNTCNTLKVNQLEFDQLKCERGMSSAQGPRVITTLENKKQVLCDTETDGGGWIIIQRRVNGKENFTRNWNDYKNGFGSLCGDFWIGNELISNITSKEIYTLRIDMRQGSNAYMAKYDSFVVKNESDQYRLHLGVFSGNIRDSFLKEHNNSAFSTPDRDNDMYIGNCAQDYKSGWWYESCHASHLNGVWGLYTYSGLWWADHSNNKNLDFVEMKLRLK